ncbi:MAG: hypothetical protein H0W87_05290 [Actinobacteria bacterium]|nr:hypothetical protein [Actinomycetota bacterium]
MSLSDELQRLAAMAEEHAGPGERLAGILVAEPHEGERVYLCAFEIEGRRTWLALDAHGGPVTSRRLVRDAASIAALCELAEEVAGGGDLDDLISRLVALRMTEAPAGIDEAEEAVHHLQRTLELAPRVASPAYLDRVGLATRRLEQALGEGGSPFAEGMKQAMAAVEKLTEEVEANYKRPPL